MSVGWSDDVDDILAGDLCAGLAYLTPAKGVMIAPMAPLGLRDREHGTVTLTSSLALWNKLERMRRNPGVAVAYHAREHGFSSRPEYVLVQGRAAIDTTPDRDWLESITPHWDRFLVPKKGGLSGRLLDAYYWQRIAIEITVERVVSGTPAADPTPPQDPPKNGTAPRVAVDKVAGDAGRLPHTLLGWCGANGLPEVVPVSVEHQDETGLRLRVPAGAVPDGGRRAGLTSHRFWPRMVGQDQHLHTGWLTADGDDVHYAPHTRAGYKLPPSKLLYHVACASLATRMRASRRAGIA
jgi:hypothetical protein